MLVGLSASLFALEEYAESITTAQRALPEVIENAGRTATDLLFGLALSLCGSGDSVRGITLVTAAVRFYGEHGIVLEPWSLPLLERFEHDARAHIGDDGYDAAVRAGEALSRDDAIALALSV